MKCDEGKGCLFEPNDCGNNDEICNFAFTFRPFPSAENPASVIFELETRIDDEAVGQYIAVGLSKDKHMVGNL